MSSKIYMITTTNQSVLSGGIIPLQTVARKYGQAIQNGNNNINILRPGYYKVSGTVSFTAPAVGDVTIAVQANSTDVPGMTSSTTVATATTELNTLPIIGLVRVLPCGYVSLSLVNTGVAIDITNVSLVVEESN